MVLLECCQHAPKIYSFSVFHIYNISFMYVKTINCVEMETRRQFLKNVVWPVVQMLFPHKKG